MLGIFDETGLTGTYDFALTYEPDYGVCKGCTRGDRVVHLLLRLRRPWTRPLQFYP
jgi:hypothetical protein